MLFTLVVKWSHSGEVTNVERNFIDRETAEFISGPGSRWVDHRTGVSYAVLEIL